MAKSRKKPSKFNVMIIGQAGRLTYEAVLFAASLRQFDPGFEGQLFVAEPQAGPNWDRDPRIQDDAAKDLLINMFGAEILPFENQHFGQSYAYGNKIEALGAMPKGEPFIFFDTDTVITGPISELALDFSRPSASERVTGTWPQPQLYGSGYEQIWGALYERFKLDFASAQDESQPPEFWKRYPYYNAGWFYGACPHAFGKLFLDYATQIKADPGPALAAQSLDPWLDQIALPLVIHALGGGRGKVPAGTLDGTHSCHYRTFPLLFARESDQVVEAVRQVTAPNKVKKVLKTYEPMLRFVFQNKGDKARAMFDRNNLPPKEKMIRNQLKRAGLWMR